MNIVKKPLPIIVSVLVVLAFAFDAFSANVMEQFVRFRNPLTAFGAVFRWIAMSGVVAVPTALLYGRRDFGAAAKYVVLPATLLALAFTRAYFDVHAAAPFEIASYWLFHLAMVAGCGAVLFMQRGEKTSIRSALVAALFGIAGCAPLNILMQIPALMLPDVLAFTAFGAWHFAFMIFFVIFAVCVQRYLREKSKASRTVILFAASLALLFQLLARFSFVRLQDYQDLHGVVSVLPFYLCSFAMAVMPIAIAARSVKFQTALFFMTSPGALIAIIYPANPVVTSIFHYNITYFVLSHTLLFAIATQLGLGLEARPERVQLKKVAAYLGVYFAAVLLIDNIVTASGLGDPNFSYVTRCPLPLPLERIGALKWGWFRFSPLYLAILYAVHILMCVATYLVFSFYAKYKKTTEAEPMKDETRFFGKEISEESDARSDRRAQKNGGVGDGKG